MILSYKDEVQLIQQPDLSEPEVPPKDKKFRGYYKISRHYKWGLSELFSYGYDFVIIVEGIVVALVAHIYESLNVNFYFFLSQMTLISRLISLNISPELFRFYVPIKHFGVFRRGTTMGNKV